MADLRGGEEPAFTPVVLRNDGPITYREEGPWDQIAERLDALTEAVWALVDVTSHQRVAPPDAPLAPAVRAAVLEGVAEVIPAVSTSFADATTFEEGAGHLTIVVQPVSRFSTVERIAAALRGVDGMTRVHVRRVQRGVVWFTVAYGGDLPPAGYLAAALGGFQAAVVSASSRQVEVRIEREDD